MNKKYKEYDGVVTNPYIGFTSFNHFRNGKLYSDCITGSGNIASCETESFECYPVPSGVEEKGREQGYYPDTTVAYIRVLWKEFEPKQGEYNYDFIQNILDTARENGQTVMFRLMPHSTCARDDVPDWLKKIMPCPERPDGMRVKDSPTDPRYLKLFGKAIEKLGEKFDKDKTLDCIDVSLGGAWGEGSTSFPQEDLIALMDIYVRVFKNTKLVGQFSNVVMIDHISAMRQIGWRADGLGSPRHMKEIYPERLKSLNKDIWKIAPVSFESYWWISEWYRHNWDIDEIIEFTLSQHVSTFNTKSFPIQWVLKDKIESWLKKMGYRFVLKETTAPDSAKVGGKLTLTLSVENKGVAPIYNDIPLKLYIESDEICYELISGIDVGKWLPGVYTEEFTVSLPKEMKAGKYSLKLGINDGDKFVRFANTDICGDGGIYIGETIIEV